MVSPRKNDYFNKQCPLYTDQGGILQGQYQRTVVWFLFTLILDLTQRYQDTFCVKLTPRIGRWALKDGLCTVCLGGFQ